MAKQQENQLLDPLVDEVMQDTDFMSYLMNQVRASENDNRARQLRQRRKGKGRATEEDKRSWAFKDDKSEDDSTEYASKPNYFSKNNDTVVIPIENLNSPALDAPSKPSMLSRLLSRLTRTKRKNNATSPHEKTSLLGSERLASYSGDVSINNNEQLPPVSQYTAINELESLSNGSNKKGEASLFDLIFSYLDILSQIKFSNTNSFFRGVSLNLGTRQQLLVQKLNKNLNEYNLPDSSAYDAMAYSKKVFDSISHLKTGRKGLPTINYRSFRKFEKRLFIPFDADKRGYQQHQNNINQNAMIHSVAKANHLHTFRDGMCFNGTKFYLSMLLGMLCGLLQFALACLPMMVWASFFASKDNIEGIETLVWPVALVCFLGGALTLPLGALIACLVFSIVLTYKETINPMTRYFKSSKQNGIAKKHQKNFQRITCVSDKVRRVLESYLSQKTKKRSTVFKDISTEIPYSIKEKLLETKKFPFSLLLQHKDYAIMLCLEQLHPGFLGRELSALGINDPDLDAVISEISLSKNIVHKQLRFFFASNNDYAMREIISNFPEDGGERDEFREELRERGQSPGNLFVFQDSGDLPLFQTGSCSY